MHKPSLLVVEHDTCLRLALSIVLGQTGCRVRVARDGFSALAEMQYELPDILVSDLDMPGRAGFELLSMVGSLFPSIKVVALSSEFGCDHVPPGVTADSFHGKGAHPQALIDLVRAMAGQFQSTRTATARQNAESLAASYVSAQSMYFPERRAERQLPLRALMAMVS